MSDEDNCYFDDLEGVLSDGEEYRLEEGDLIGISFEDFGLEDVVFDIFGSESCKKWFSFIFIFKVLKLNWGF